MTAATTSSGVSDPATLLARAAAIRPVLERNADVTDSLRRLADENVAALIESGLCRLMVPARFGGHQTSIRTYVDVMAEVGRVLRPGGKWVFSTTHPFRWCFRDDPGPGGLVVESSYFDRRAYVEQDERGRATYVEHHRTIGDRVREIVAAGLVVDDVVEPEWPADHEQAWDQWSPLRGRLMPGTVIFVTHKP